MLKPLNKVVDLKDPLKQFVSTWSFSFPAGSYLNTIFPTSEVEDLELRCQSYGLPTMTGDQTEVTWGGYKRIYAGKQTRQGSWTVNFVEVWDASIIDGFKDWLNLYHQYKDGKITLLNDYSTYANIKLLDPDVYNTDIVTEPISEYSLRLYDVFPMEVNASQIEASSSEPITLEVTFNYNYFLLGNEIEAAQSNG